MALTIAEIIKQAALDVGIEEPSGTITTSTQLDVKKLLQFAVNTGRELRSKYLFPQLVKKYSFTGGASDTQYVLPGDFWKMVNDTGWDQSNNWQMRGPLSQQGQNAFLYGIVSSLARKRYYVTGSDYTSGQFFLNPAPAAGDTLSFDYIRSQWFMPAVWTASESVTSGTTYRFSSGNLYLAQTTNPTGSTAPSHTSGTASDGTVTWLYVTTQVYSTTDRFLADTDFPLIDDDLIMMGTVWRYLERGGYEHERLKRDYYNEASARSIRMTGAPIVSQANEGVEQLISYDNIPEGGFG